MLEPQIYRGTGGGAIVPEVSDETHIEVEDSSDDFARVVASPLPPGFGTTLGNALRRVLLSSLPGAAVTSVRVDGVQHEFSTMPNVKEDMIEFLLNVKEIRIRALAERPGTLVLDISGRAGPVTAADIQVPEHYEIVNPEIHLATIDSKSGRFYVEFNVEAGTGYVPAGAVDGTTLGVIPVDAIFSPVRRVTYKVEHTRVGQATNYDKLTLEVWTDGTLNGVEAVSRSADILIEQFKLFSHMGRPALPVVERGLGAGVVLTPDKFNMPIEDLSLSMRAYNCLRRSGLMTVGQVLEKSEEELLALRNFGRKSYDELRDKLDELGLLPLGGPEDELVAAPPLGDEEGPLVAPTAVAEPAEETGAAPPEEPAEEAEEEPKPKAKRASRAKKAAASDEGDGEGDEVPEWKRKLMELTGDEGKEE